MAIRGSAPQPQYQPHPRPQRASHASKVQRKLTTYCLSGWQWHSELSGSRSAKLCTTKLTLNICAGMLLDRGSNARYRRFGRSDRYQCRGRMQVASHVIPAVYVTQSHHVSIGYPACITYFGNIWTGFRPDFATVFRAAALGCTCPADHAALAIARLVLPVLSQFYQC